MAIMQRITILAKTPRPHPGPIATYNAALARLKALEAKS